MPSFKVEFSTVRELEKKTFRVFAYGGAGFGVGVVLILLGLAIIGAPVLLLSVAVVIGAMAYVSVLGKEKARPLFCPYCSSKNDVYVSKSSFDCDICRRPILVTEFGEAVAAEEIDTRAQYNS